MTAPTSLTLTNDPDLGVVVMRDGDDMPGVLLTYTLTDDDQPLNHGRLQQPATKFIWPDTLYAGTIKVHLDHIENDVSTPLDAELVLATDVNPHLLAGEYPGTPPPVATSPTGATQGAPGTWDPPGSAVPADLASLTLLGPLGQTAAWTTGNYNDLGDASQASWDGTAWVAGAAAGARKTESKAKSSK